MVSQSLQNAAPKADQVAEWEEQKSWQPSIEGSVATSSQRKQLQIYSQGSAGQWHCWARVGVSTAHLQSQAGLVLRAQGSAQSEAP